MVDERGGQFVFKKRSPVQKKWKNKKALRSPVRSLLEKKKLPLAEPRAEPKRSLLEKKVVSCRAGCGAQTEPFGKKFTALRNRLRSPNKAFQEQIKVLAEPAAEPKRSLSGKK